MYCIKRTISKNKVAYLKPEGWQVFDNCPLDLDGVALFTERETKLNPPPPGQEYQWYGGYKKL